MSDIPSEMFREILRRVPVEDLFMYRSVCKSWRRIIDDPTFAKLHIRRGVGGDWFLHRNNTGKVFLLPLKEMVFKKSFYVEWVRATNVKTLVGRGVPRMPDFPVPCCNGLILISTCKNNLTWRIWNPFTGESLELGRCDEFADLKCGNFDYPYSGIGYDEDNDDYKVVRIVEFRTYIYSVNSREWRRIDDFPDSPSGNWNGVFAYGALHWFARSRDRNDILECVVALDLITEKYRKIPLALEITEVYGPCLELDALNGFLFLSCSAWRGRFVAWMSNDYGRENIWMKMISFDDRNHIRPMAYLKSKERVLLRYGSDVFSWYDIRKRCSERLVMEVNTRVDDFDDYREYLYDTFSSQVLPASLIRLKRSGGADESVALEATSKRKRKRCILERLPLKLVFGDPDKWEDDYMENWMDDDCNSDSD
ncbi:hypothetical protein OROGR_010787 [Orobanche gracilis]